MAFVAARCRPNTLLATAYDLKVFFTAVPKDPVDIVTADVFAFITAQKAPRRGSKVVRLEDGEAGLSARTIKRRLASVSGLFGYLITRDDLGVVRNPVPTGLAGRRRGGNRGAPLLRTPRTLPRVLGPGEVETALGAVNTARDRAMLLAMVLGGLRRCEVLGLRVSDLSPGERRVFVAEGKGGHQRLIPISGQFFAAVGDYLDRERPRVEPRSVVRRASWTAAWFAAVGRRLGRDPRRCPQAHRAAAADLPSAAAHLPDAAARGRHGAGGRAGPGRSPVHRVDPDLHPPGELLAGGAVPGRVRRHRRRPGRALMPRAAALPIVCPDLVESYLAHRAVQGMGTDHKVRWGARALLAAVPDLDDFRELPLERQLGFNHETHRFISWLAVTGRMQPGADYLVARRPRLGIVMARTDPELHLRFMETARSLGFRDAVAMTQFNLLGHFVALTGKLPHQLQQTDWDEGRRVLLDAAGRIPSRGVKALSTALFNLEATLFHCGLTDHLPRRRTPDRADVRAAEWSRVPQPMAAVMQHYLQQVTGTLRPGTVKNTELTLREFALLVAAEDADVVRVADLKRRHIERYRQWLLERPAARGGPLHRHTVRDRLSKLRGFFRRLDEWDADDRPIRQLIFDSDFPIADEPLPRFLDDAAAARLLTAARQHPDPFVRLAIEILARTGMRRSEMLGLTVDAVVQIGSAYWLRVPVGKMHTDRYVPLHPQLKLLLDDWLAHRPDGLRSNLLFTDRGRPVNASRIEQAVREAAARAGLGRVTPHQLRHTLATQAINRGMSLEAIAALLGHRSLSMTRVYARIADRTVADEYFAVTEKVEALYDAPRRLPAAAEGSEMRKLRAEVHRRMLGNGYCARPVEMDCHFESICESCTFFVTTIEFRPTLERQRDDAAKKGQVAREQIFNGLLTRLDEQAG